MKTLTPCIVFTEPIKLWNNSSDIRVQYAKGQLQKCIHMLQLWIWEALMLNACARKQPDKKIYNLFIYKNVQFIFNLFTLNTNKQHWAKISYFTHECTICKCVVQICGFSVVNKPSEMSCCASKLPSDMWASSRYGKWPNTELLHCKCYPPTPPPPQACLVLSGPLSAGSSKQCWQEGFPRDHGWITEQACKAQAHTLKRSGGSVSEHMFESPLSELMD